MGMERAAEGVDHRWQTRRGTAVAVRVAVIVAPIIGSTAVVVLLAAALPPPDELGTVWWWTAILSASAATVFLIDRAARQVLPLVGLLRLSLLFPGPPPSRLAVIRHSTRRNLDALVSRITDEGMPEDPDEAARTIVVLLAALNRHDVRTRGHSERVRAIADHMADEIDLDDGDRDRLRWAALLHDIGKLMVPAHVLNSHDRPTDADWELLRQHPGAGDRLATPLKPWLGEWGDTILHHHERWDGGGYPGGLAGEQISRGARIVSVADSFDVMTSLRSYRPIPLSPEAAKTELVDSADGQFDPAAVRALLNVSTKRLWRIAGPLAWAVQVPFVGAMAQSPALVSAIAAAAQTGVSVGVATAPHGGPEELSEWAREAPAIGAIVPEIPLPTTSTTAATATSAAATTSTSIVTGGAPPRAGCVGPGPQSPTSAPAPDATSSTTTTSTSSPATSTTTGPGSSPDRSTSSMDTSAPTPSSATTTRPPPAVVDAVDDGFALRPGSEATLTVLANDRVPGGGGAPAVTVLDDPRLGVLTVVGNELSYEAGDASGIDTFRYELRGAKGGCDVATVTVTIG